MARKRSYDTLVGGSVGWNQLCNGDTVTVQNGHKYVMKKSGTVSLGASTGTAITGLTSGTDTVTDLTLLLGSTIADHIYSLETATSGAGIAKLREWGFISDAYIPYDAGSIESVEASAKVTRDASDNIIGNYPLDSSLILRGIPKLDSNGQLYYDGDRYEADGPVTRKYNTTTVSEAVEVGTSSGGVKYARVNTLPDAKNNGYVFSAKYVYRNVVNVDKVIRMIGTSVYIYDNRFTDTSTANDILQGEELLYELATPTTESAVPFTNPQIVDPDGTEEYVTANGVPVGHETRYQL